MNVNGTGRQRIDALLVAWRLAPSRTKAQALVAAGSVWRRRVDGGWVAVRKPSENFHEYQKEEFEIRDETVLKYVSRGGLKLEGALEQTGVAVNGRTVADIGLSTGGFTDCLLCRGAECVVGIEVGHDQLAQPLKNERRLRAFEGLHIKDAMTHPEAGPLLRLCDLAVADVSFISLTQILPYLRSGLASGHEILALVKPQFELSAAALDKRGIVKDPSAYRTVEQKLRFGIKDLGYTVQSYFPSSVTGADGNQEFFIHLT